MRDKERYVALVSDTHGHADHTRTALRLLDPFAPIRLIHAGDVGTPETFGLFPTAWDCHFVRGNCDDATRLGPAAVAAGHSWHGAFGRWQVDDRRIAWLHGDDERALDRAIQGGEFDLVIHGHTHVRGDEHIGDTWVVNPGAVHRATPRSVAVLDLQAWSVHFLDAS